MKKILLITPPCHTGSAGLRPSLEILYLADSLRQTGYEVVVYDAITPDGLGQIANRIALEKPDIVGTMAYNSFLNVAIDVLHEVKKANHAIITVIGGIHPSLCYEDVLKTYPEIVDFVIRGNAEETLVELVEVLDGVWDAGQLSAVKGLCYLSEGGVIASEPRPFVRRLDNPLPARDVVVWNADYLHVVSAQDYPR